MILFIFGILLLFLGNGYETPINYVAKGWTENDSDKIIHSMFSDEMLESLDNAEKQEKDAFLEYLWDIQNEVTGETSFEIDKIDNIDKSTDGWLKYLKNKHGDNLQISFEIDNINEIDEKHLNKYQEFYDNTLGIDIEVKDGYKISAKMIVEGDDDSNIDDNYDFTVLKLKGEGWKIYPAEGLLFELYFSN